MPEEEGETHCAEAAAQMQAAMQTKDMSQVRPQRAKMGVWIVLRVCACVCVCVYARVCVRSRNVMSSATIL